MLRVNKGAEFDQWVRNHPNVVYLDAFTNDLNNIERGKRIPITDAGKLWQEGLYMPSSLLCLDATGDDLNPLGRGIDDGDPDGLWHPIAGTLAPIPWSDTPAAQVLLAHSEADGSTSQLDPRAILSRALGYFSAMGLCPVVAFELEFYLVDPLVSEAGFPFPPKTSADQRETSKQPYSLVDLDRHKSFIADVTEAARIQNVPASTAITEFSPGQFEINLRHEKDGLAAADHAVLLKRVIRNIARKHGHLATFMAKPFPAAAGSGMHLHLSMMDRHGENIFASGQPQGSVELHYAIGGILSIMKEAMAIWAPNANSYRRFLPSSHVARQTGWGINNRSVACRIPLGPPESRRVEFRLPGADANPYLTLAALLAGIHHGLEQKIVPPPPLTGDATQSVTLPIKWWDALAEMNKGRVLPRYFGETYVRLYHEAKTTEMDRFYALSTRHEFDWYL